MFSVYNNKSVQWILKSDKIQFDAFLSLKIKVRLSKKVSRDAVKKGLIQQNKPTKKGTQRDLVEKKEVQIKTII